MQYKESFREFDFNRDFEAVVIDNSNFDDYHEVSLFVFELIMTTLQKDPISIKKNLSNANIINIEDIISNEQIEMCNYLVCRPIIPNDIDKNLRKPEIGSRVILRFHNGNPKFPYFVDYHLPRKVKFDEEVPVHNNKINGTYYRILTYRKQNMSGKDVDVVGKGLRGLGYTVNDINNHYIYDLTMQESVLNFQTDNNLTPDGIVGPITFKKIIERYNKQSYC